jgi:polyribonucleotide nucleotidyltransferase
MNQEIKKYEMDFGGKPLEIEVGRYAAQADGACVVRHGDTMVLATAVMGKEPRPGMSYFPLMVDYEERMYAAGKISGSRFVKREGRPTEEAVLTARMVDRSIRPLFDDSIRLDVQVMITVLSVDGDNDPDIPAVIAAATALGISRIPWDGPIGAVRVTAKGGGYQLNSTYLERAEADVDIFVSGTGQEVVMIEAEGKQCEEEKVEKAVGMSIVALDPVVKLIQKIITDVGVEKYSVASTEVKAEDVAALKKVQAIVDAVDFTSALSKGKRERDEKISELNKVKAIV